MTSMNNSRVSDTGMDKRLWNKDAVFALKLNKFIVWPLGLWPFNTNDAFSLFRIAFAFASQLWLITTMVTATFLKCGDATEVVDYIMLSVCGMMAITKIIAIRVHMEKIRKVFLASLNDWSTMVFGYISNTLIIIGTLPFLMPPITNGTAGNDTSMMIMRQLPLKTGCMFAHYRDEIYGTLYAFESFTITITAHGNVGCDVFLFSLAMHLCGQIELLKHKIMEIIVNPEELNDAKLRINTFIQRHIHILEMANALSKSVSGMMVVQLVLNAGINLMLGIRVIMALKSGSPFDAIRPIFAFNVLMLQLYLISYASDRLSSHAQSILDAVYDSNWYELPPNLRRSLYFVAMRTNKPIYLMAGNFYAINIENFKNILKASFSYFSILRVMFDG